MQYNPIILLDYEKDFLVLFCCIPVMEVCSCSDYEEYMPEEDVLQERQMSVAQADEKLLDAVFHESSQSWVYLQGDSVTELG